MLSDLAILNRHRTDLDEDISMLNKGEGLNRVFRDMKCVVFYHSSIGIPALCVGIEGKTSNIHCSFI